MRSAVQRAERSERLAALVFHTQKSPILFGWPACCRFLDYVLSRRHVFVVLYFLKRMDVEPARDALRATCAFHGGVGEFVDLALSRLQQVLAALATAEWREGVLDETAQGVIAHSVFS